MRHFVLLSTLVLGACGGDFAGVSGNAPPTEAGADAPGDGTVSDGTILNDGGPVEPCPPTLPSGACSGAASCTYGCTSCFCTGGAWQCVAPGCAGGCPSSPPAAGTSCGGCCGPTVGMSCDYACPDGVSTFKATCEGSGTDGTWQVGPCAGPKPGAGYVGCGATECDLDAGQACCDTIKNDAGTHACGALAQGSFCLSGAVETCDEKADCPANQVCCIQFLPQGIQAGCLPTCVTNLERYQACTTDAECENGGPCAPHACPAGEAVRTCEKPPACQ